jgi:hypothetical protein
VYVADTDITTKKDTSGGIHAAGGGTLYVGDGGDGYCNLYKDGRVSEVEP